MKKSISLFILICASVFMQAQNNIPKEVLESRSKELDRLNLSIKAINEDLETQSHSFNWSLMESFLDLCQNTIKRLNSNDYPQLGFILYEETPKELMPQKEIYENASKKLKELLKQYPEYILLDSIQKEAATEEARKMISTKMNAFYNRLCDINKDFRPIRAKQQKALSEYQISGLRYLLKEFKSKNMPIPTDLINFKDREYIFQHNPALEQQSALINQMKNYQKELIQHYVKLKYNLFQTK